MELRNKINKMIQEGTKDEESYQKKERIRRNNAKVEEIIAQLCEIVERQDREAAEREKQLKEAEKVLKAVKPK